jgi:hypothetical protein
MDSCLVHLCAWSWPLKLRIRPPIEGFRLDPRFLVEFSCDSILGDLVCLRTQVLGHSIPYGCFTSSPNLSSRAQAIWEIHGRIGGLGLAVSGWGCCSRAWRTVRGGQADCPWGAVRPGVLSVRRKFLFHLVSIRRVGGFHLEEVGRTVRLGWLDSPRGSDHSRCLPRQSVIRGALLEVRFLFLDRPSLTRRPSARTTRTVRPVTADCPPGASQSC